MFSVRLEEIIEERGITKEDLAKGLGLKDCSMIYRWIKSVHVPTLSSANAVANFFNCSLDYLAGRTEDFKPVKAQELKPFGTQFRKVIKNAKISQNNIIKNLNISTHSIVSWLNNKTIPNFSSVIKLANYLNISIDELVGRE